MVHNKIRITHNNVTTELTPFGREFQEADDLITREERAADGTLRRDIIAMKKRFTLAYETIDGDKIDLFEELLLKKAPFPFSVERRNGSFETYSVLLQPFSRARLSARGHGLLSGFTAEFVEV